LRDARAVYPAATALTNELAEVAIQDAANHLTAGGTVLLPQGTFSLSPSDPDAAGKEHQFAIAIPDGVQIQGAGAENTRLIVRPSGPYRTVFLCAQGAGNVGLSDFTIDHQSSLNPMANRDEIVAYRRSTLLWRGSVPDATATIRRLRVIHSISGNDLLLTYGGAQGRNVLAQAIIEDNHFEEMGGGEVSWDSSVIFAEVKHLHIVHNTVRSTANSFNLHQTFSGIEAYGLGGEIAENVVSGYHCAIIFGGWNVVVTGNQGDTSQSGILMNSSPMSVIVGSTAYGLQHCRIEGNTIRIHNAASRYNSIIRTSGIGIYPTQHVGSKDVTISSNTIVYDIEPNEDKLRTLDPNSAGIGFYSTPADYTWEDVSVHDNVVRNAPYGGFVTNVGIQNWAVSKNSFVNCGSFPSDQYAESRTPVRVAAAHINGLDFSANTVIDGLPKAGARVAYSFNTSATAGDASGVKIENNELIVPDGSPAKTITKYQVGPHVPAKPVQ